MNYCTTYKEIKATRKPTIRARIRNLALDGFYVADVLSNAKTRLKLPRIQFLYLHHVFEDEEQQLRDLLKFLSEDHQFISYSAAVEKILSGQVDASYVCISSDDGFKNNIRAAAILDEFGAKACFFINPWVAENRSYEEIKAHCRQRLNFPPVEFMNWDDIQNLQKAGHEIGSHTMQHIDVAKVSSTEFAADCEQCYNTLMSHCGEARHFAFPYGRFSNFNAAAADIVFAAGFESCASAERGCHVSSGKDLSARELCIRRDHVILDWKLAHIMHFITANTKTMGKSANYFPY